MLALKGDIREVTSSLLRGICDRVTMGAYSCALFAVLIIGVVILQTPTLGETAYGMSGESQTWDCLQSRIRFGQMLWLSSEAAVPIGRLSEEANVAKMADESDTPNTPVGYSQ